MSHHEGPAVFPQLQRSEALAMLLGVPADPLEDGSLQVVVDQEVLNWQLLRRQLRLPGQQWNEAHWPVHLGPPTCLRGLLKEVEKRLRVVLRPHLLQRHVGGRAGAGGIPPARTSRSIQLRNSSRSCCWFWTRAQKRRSWSSLMSSSAW